MDDEYNLGPGEVLIMQSEGAVLLSGKDEIDLDEVALTNQNLILVNEVSTGLFSSQRLLKRCPLESIACPEGAPQAFVGKKHDMYVLQVAFAEEGITLHFPSNEKREAKRWADAIKYAVVGDIDSIDTEATPLGNDVTGLIDGVTGFVSAFVSEATSATKEVSKKNNPPRKTVAGKATAKCSGCHAPLFGTKGSIVTCEYCGSKQTL